MPILNSNWVNTSSSNVIRDKLNIFAMQQKLNISSTLFSEFQPSIGDDWQHHIKVLVEALRQVVGSPHWRVADEPLSRCFSWQLGIQKSRADPSPSLLVNLPSDTSPRRRSPRPMVISDSAGRGWLRTSLTVNDASAKTVTESLVYHLIKTDVPS